MTGPTPTEGGDRVCFHSFTASLTAGAGSIAQTSACLTHRHMHEPTTLLTVSTDRIRRRLGAVLPRLYGTIQTAKVAMSTIFSGFSDDADHMTIPVDSGASGHYFDDEFQPKSKA